MYSSNDSLKKKAREDTFFSVHATTTLPHEFLTFYEQRFVGLGN
jgi:hypothetical protein